MVSDAEIGPRKPVGSIPAGGAAAHSGFLISFGRGKPKNDVIKQKIALVFIKCSVIGISDSAG